MRFKKFYTYNDINLDNINKAFFESARDHFQSIPKRKNIDKIFLMTDEELEKDGFYIKFPHLK